MINAEIHCINSSPFVFQVRGEQVANLSFIYTGEGTGTDCRKWVIFDSPVNKALVEEAIVSFNYYLDRIFNPLLRQHPPTGGAVRFFPLIGADTIAAVILANPSRQINDSLQHLKRINGGDLKVYLSPATSRRGVSRLDVSPLPADKGRGHLVVGNIQVCF